MWRYSTGDHAVAWLLYILILGEENENDKKKRAVAALAGIVVCLMLSVGAAVSAQAAGRQVYDDAGLFSDSEISELTAAVNVAEEETGWDLMLLT